MDEHPFRAAWRTRDVDAWDRALADDVVLHSPIVTAPFEGREAARELYAALFETFGPVEISDELTEDATSVFFWRGQLGRRTVEGVDLLRHDASGKVVEIRVMIRPLVGIATFAAGLGPRLAAERSPRRARLARILTRPLGPMFAAIDAVSARLIQRR